MMETKVAIGVQIFDLKNLYLLFGWLARDKR